MERLEVNDRMKRKRKPTDDLHDVVTFNWGTFHFWKRPPTPVKAPFGGWSVRCYAHHVAATDTTREVDCKRECNLRHPGDEENVIKRLKMWSLGYCCCENKIQHFKYMREYPADKYLFDTQAVSHSFLTRSYPPSLPSHPVKNFMICTNVHFLRHQIESLVLAM